MEASLITADQRRFEKPQDNDDLRAAAEKFEAIFLNEFLFFINSKHSVITFVSTQPPETDPKKLPFSLIIILLPIWNGEDPHV